MSNVQKKAVLVMALAAAESAFRSGMSEFTFMRQRFEINRFGRDAGRVTVAGEDAGIRFYHGKAVYA